MKPLCIYHGNCADGFGAAYAVWKRFGEEFDYFAATHQDPPPDVSRRDVVMVDFAYKRPVLDEMAAQAKSILVLDHHKSAAEDLADLPPVPAWPEADPHMVGWMPISGLYATFDMQRSGAGIAWDHFHGRGTRPKLIDHIEDRDLWRFALPGTREIQAALFSYPYDFAIWDRLMAPENGLGLLAQDGAAIERKHHKDVAELVGVTKRHMRIGGHVVPVANLPYTLTSDAGHLMCEPIDEGLAGLNVPPFAACYWDTPEGRVFSLRSVDKWGAVDVSAVAKQYGGGGHKNAAGFRVSLADAAQFELNA